jgi:hypothetical protein
MALLTPNSISEASSTIAFIGLLNIHYFNNRVEAARHFLAGPVIENAGSWLRRRRAVMRTALRLNVDKAVSPAAFGIALAGLPLVILLALVLYLAAELNALEERVGLLERRLGMQTAERGTTLLTPLPVRRATASPANERTDGYWGQEGPTLP